MPELWRAGIGIDRGAQAVAPACINGGFWLRRLASTIQACRGILIGLLMAADVFRHVCLASDALELEKKFAAIHPVEKPARMNA